MNRIKSLVLAVCITFFAANVSAQICVPEPNCTAMGYNKTEASCTGKYILRCPFDTSKVFCGGRTCNYTSTTKPVNCAEAPSCTYENTSYYSDTCTTCDSGYSLAEGRCVADCGYTSTTSPSNCSSVDSCTKDGTMYYICTFCNSGYALKDGTCCRNTCEGSYNGSCDGTISTSTDGCGNTCYYCNSSYVTVQRVRLASMHSCYGAKLTCYVWFSSAVYNYVEYGELSSYDDCSENGNAVCEAAFYNKDYAFTVEEAELIK